MGRARVGAATKGLMEMYTRAALDHPLLIADTGPAVWSRP